MAKLNAGFVKTMQAPEVKQNLSDLGVEIVGSTPEQFAATIRTDLDKWMRLAKLSRR